jgi:signal transduction histidine kinase
LLDAARQGVRRLPHRDDVGIDVSGEPIVVRGDPTWIRQIVTNLVANADRHATGRICVTTARSGGYGRLSVADDGPGFPTELIPHAFDRFTRGDSARTRARGGGTATVANGPPLGGARVDVDLPVAPS